MNEQHPYRKCRLWEIWKGIKKRCYSPTRPEYRSYGRKGIVMCDAWKTSYVAFREWSVANGYEKSLTIDRINGGNYEPDNCRWIPLYENTTRRFPKHELWGESKLLAQWSRDERSRVNAAQLRNRLYNGWALETALTTPPNPPGRPRQHPHP